MHMDGTRVAWGGGAGALAAPRARAAAAVGLHADRRADRADRADDPARARAGGGAVRGLAPGRPGADRVGQPVGAQPARSRPGVADRRPAHDLPPGPVGAPARDHREHADVGPRPLAGHAHAAEPARRRAVGRRLRHRLLVARQPPPPADRRAQDRPVVRVADAERRERPDHRALDDQPGPRPRPEGRRRRRRGRGHAAPPRGPRLRPRPGLPLLQAAAGRGVQQVDRRPGRAAEQPTPAAFQSTEQAAA